MASKDGHEPVVIWRRDGSYDVEPSEIARTINENPGCSINFMVDFPQLKGKAEDDDDEDDEGFDDFEWGGIIGSAPGQFLRDDLDNNSLDVLPDKAQTPIEHTTAGESDTAVESTVEHSARASSPLVSTRTGESLGEKRGYVPEEGEDGYGIQLCKRPKKRDSTTED